MLSIDANILESKGTQNRLTSHLQRIIIMKQEYKTGDVELLQIALKVLYKWGDLGCADLWVETASYESIDLLSLYAFAPRRSRPRMAQCMSKI